MTDLADTLRYRTGYDSLTSTINLGIKPVARFDKWASISDETFFLLPSGNIITSSCIYHDTLKYKAGCDSVINTIKLSVFAAKTVNTLASICAGQACTMPSEKVLRRLVCIVIPYAINRVVIVCT